MFKAGKSTIQLSSQQVFTAHERTNVLEAAFLILLELRPVLTFKWNHTFGNLKEVRENKPLIMRHTRLFLFISAMVVSPPCLTGRFTQLNHGPAHHPLLVASLGPRSHLTQKVVQIQDEPIKCIKMRGIGEQFVFPDLWRPQLRLTALESKHPHFSASPPLIKNLNVLTPIIMLSMRPIPKCGYAISGSHNMQNI